MDFADLEKWIVVDENEHSEEDDLSTTLLSIEHTTTSQASFPITIDSPHAAETAYIQDQQKSCNIIISSSTCCPSLPGELLEIIVSHLRRSPESLSILAQVNRQWYSICTPLLWRNPMPSTISKMRRLAHVIQSRSESSLRLAFLKPFLSHYNSPGPANDQDIEVSGIESGASTPKSTSSHHWYCSTGPGGGGINNNPLSLIHEFSLGGYEWDLYDEVLTSSSFIPYRLTKWWSKQWWLRLTRQIADKCPNLIRLDLSSCGTWITDESLSKILKHCSRIQDLSLSNCYKLSDESLSLIGSSIKNLKRIDLANIQRMTSSSLHSIIMDSNVQLLHLNISGCNISNASIM